MKIKIETKNKEKIEAALNAVQGKCRERLVDFATVLQIAEKIEKRLTVMGVPKKNRPGMVFEYQNGHKMPNCYNGAPESTQFRVEISASGYFLTGVSRTYCNHTRDIVFVNEQNFKQFYTF